MKWQLQDAKNQFSKVVNQARTIGPQVVTIRGVRAAVVVSADDFDKLTADKPSLVEYILSGPAWDDEMTDAINRRDKGLDRDIEL